MRVTGHSNNRIRRVTALALSFLLAVAACVLAASTADAYDPNNDGIPGPPSLPDSNYEQVTPADKNGVSVSTQAPLLRADGERALSLAAEPFGDTPSAAVLTSYVSARTEEGWRTKGISPLQAQQIELAPLIPVMAFDPSWSHSVFRSTFPLLEGIDRNVTNFYLQETESGAIEQLTSSAIPGSFQIGGSYSMHWGDSSQDLRRGVFHSTDNLTTDATGTDSKTYLWSEGEELELAGVDTAGDPLPTPSTPAGTYTGDGGNPPHIPSSTGNAMSDDGSRFFFYAPNLDVNPGAQESQGSGPLWVRTDDGESPATTTRIGSGDVRFWFATPDGSKVVYQTSGGSPGWTTGGTLVLHDVESGAETELSLTTHPDGPQVNSFVAASDDASRVYFTALGKLTDDAPAPDGNSVRLYAWIDDGSGGELRYVADLGPWGSASVKGGRGSDFDNVTYDERISSDGSVLAFLTDGQVTDYDNQGATMLYVYDADANGGEGELSCASCNPTGDPPIDARPLNAIPETFVTTSEGSFGQYIRELPRGITDDGSKVYFTSADPLSPDDVNGGKYDAYVYDVETGDAELISSGRSGHDSFYADNSTDGATVTFWSAERLVGWDTDDNVDLYAAVEGGGFAEPELVRPCEGDACQGALPAAPAAEAPSTGTYAGSGNPSDRSRSDCSSLERRANVTSRKARRLARKARRAEGKAKRRLRKKSTRARRGAKRAKKRAARCERGTRS